MLHASRLLAILRTRIPRIDFTPFTLNYFLHCMKSFLFSSHAAVLQQTRLTAKRSPESTMAFNKISGRRKLEWKIDERR